MNTCQVLALAETAGTGREWDVTEEVKGASHYNRSFKSSRPQLFKG